jgi:hypothetical protein
MIQPETWKALTKVLDLSPNLRFSLEWSRRSSKHGWQAVIFTEKGRVLAHGFDEDADLVVKNVLEPASAEVTRLKMGQAR